MNNLVSDCKSSLFALSVLKRHGIEPTQMDRLFNALIVSRLTYVAPSWSGFLKESGWASLQAVLDKGHKWGLSPNLRDIRKIFEAADSMLFTHIIQDNTHCLHCLLPPVKITGYDLRPRPHNRTIPLAITNLPRCSFIQRMLQKDSY